jgi:hypothetical protein
MKNTATKTKPTKTSTKQGKEKGKTDTIKKSDSSMTEKRK